MSPFARISFLLALLVAAACYLLLNSCINIPPPAPMGDGAIQQIGLFNYSQDNQRINEPPGSPSARVKVTNDSVEVTLPKTKN